MRVFKLCGNDSLKCHHSALDRGVEERKREGSNLEGVFKRCGRYILRFWGREAGRDC